MALRAWVTRSPGWVSERIGEDWTAIVGGVLCVVAIIVVALMQRTFLRDDARHPSP